MSSSLRNEQNMFICLFVCFPFFFLICNIPPDWAKKNIMNVPPQKTAKIFTFSVCLFSLSFYSIWWHNILSSSNYGKIANILRTLPVCLFLPLFLISLKLMTTKQLRDIAMHWGKHVVLNVLGPAIWMNCFC